MSSWYFRFMIKRNKWVICTDNKHCVTRQKYDWWYSTHRAWYIIASGVGRDQCTQEKVNMLRGRSSKKCNSITEIFPGCNFYLWLFQVSCIFRNNMVLKKICLRKYYICHFLLDVNFDEYTHHPHDDAIKWKYFPRYWPFVRGINR